MNSSTHCDGCPYSTRSGHPNLEEDNSPCNTCTAWFDPTPINYSLEAKSKQEK